MRVIECNECGETLQAANDAELVQVVSAHMQSEHDEEVDEEESPSWWSPTPTRRWTPEAGPGHGRRADGDPARLERSGCSARRAAALRRHATASRPVARSATIRRSSASGAALPRRRATQASDRAAGDPRGYRLASAR